MRNFQVRQITGRDPAPQTSASAVTLSLRFPTRAAILKRAPPQRCHPVAERRDLRLFLPLLLETSAYAVNRAFAGFTTSQQIIANSRKRSSFDGSEICG